MDWKIIIRHYKSNHEPRKENEHNWFRRQPSIESAIKNATEAKDERGKQYSHQRRIDKNAMREAKTVLLENADEIEKSKSFHHLWLLPADDLNFGSSCWRVFSFAPLRSSPFLRHSLTCRK